MLFIIINELVYTIIYFKEWITQFSIQLNHSMGLCWFVYMNHRRFADRPGWWAYAELMVRSWCRGCWCTLSRLFDFLCIKSSAGTYNKTNAQWEWICLLPDCWGKSRTWQWRSVISYLYIYMENLEFRIRY